MDFQYDLNGHQGFYEDAGNLISFQIGSEATSIVDTDPFNNLNIPILYRVGEFKVLIKGKNNQLPGEIQTMVGNNRLLPELIEKQVRILYGKGLFTYKTSLEDKTPVREWQDQKEIMAWFNSWQSKGLPDSVEQVGLKIIRDYYYFEDYFIKWRYIKGRRTGVEIPVFGLEHIDDRRCRLATDKDIDLSDDPEDSDFEAIIVGNWKYGNERSFKVYNRFMPGEPLKTPISMSYHKNASVGEIYGKNKYYEGVKEWLTAMNRNPRYINSFLKNSLSAKIHLIIPQEWVDSVKDKLKDYTEENADREDEGKALVRLNGLDIGTKYTENLKDKYIASEIRKLGKFLSGADNQGKIYATTAYSTSDGNTIQWKLEPIDLKYKEYIETLNSNDRRADEVVLGAKGLDASISSLSKEGVISKSGADLYYNYLIYLSNLPPAEMICTEAFNTAIRVNFPTLYAEGYRIGFYSDVPSRQEDVAPADRLQNTINGLAQGLKEVQDRVSELSGATK